LETKNLRVLIVSPEVVPFAKTGGLADVTGALPKVLAQLGHQVKVILPKYKMVDENKFHLSEVKADFPAISIGGKDHKISLKSDQVDFPPVEYLFMVNDKFYFRDELYRNRATGYDYEDNDERFILFARGTGYNPCQRLAIGFDSGIPPDIICG
jgi:starch synthase